MRWRMRSFGFQKTFAVPGNTETTEYFYHFNGGNWAGDPKAFPGDTEENSSLVAYHNTLRRKGKFYEASKYGERGDNVWGDEPEKPLNQYKFFNVPYYPVDVWVSDYKQRSCFHKREYSYSTQEWSRPKRCVYDCNVLIENGVLGSAQIKEMRCEDGNGGTVRFD